MAVVRENDSPMVHRSGGWKQSLAVLPGVAAALLPSVTCPACWPGYAAVLSSFGIGFLPNNRYLLQLTTIFLIVYLFILARDARRRRRFGSLALGAAGSTILMVGRYVLELDYILYTGVVLLMTASISNAWHALHAKLFAKQKVEGNCPACRSVVPAVVQPVETLYPKPRKLL